MKDMELGQIVKIIFQSVYYRLKISKKENFFLLRANSYRFDKSWLKIKIFHARGSSYMVKRRKSNADLDLLLLPSFL